MSEQEPPRRAWRPCVLGLTAAFAALLVVIVVLADRGELPDFLGIFWRFPFGDALCHFLLVGGLAFLVNLSLRARRFRLWRLLILVGSVVVGVAVTLEEASQVFLPHRTFSWLDLFADYAGIAVMGRAALYLVRRSEARPPEGSDPSTEPQAEAAEEPKRPAAKSGPSRRAIIGWTVGMLTALGLAWFVGAVAMPLWNTRASVERCNRICPAGGPSCVPEIERLGGPERAAQLLALYLRLPRRLAPHPSAAAVMLGECGPDALPHLEKLMKHADSSVRSYGADALAKNKLARAVELLIAALGDENDWVRTAAARALVHTHNAQAIEPLIAALKDRDRDVRYFSAHALGKLGAAQAVGPLVACLRDESVLVRRDAATALGEIGDARAVEPLIGVALNETDREARWAAAMALAKLKDPRCVNPLVADLEKGNSLLPVWVLGEVGPAAKPAVPALERIVKAYEEYEHSPLLFDDSRQLLQAARDALRKIRAAEGKKSKELK